MNDPKNNIPISGKGIASVAKNSLHLFSGFGIVKLARFFYLLILARTLGAELYGIFGYATSWYMAFLGATGLGLGQVMAKEVGADPKKGGETVRLAWSVRAAVSLVAALICGASALFMEKNPDVARVMLIFSAALPGRAISIWADSAFNAYEKNQYFLRQQSVFRLLEFTSGAVFLLAGGKLSAIAFIHAVSWWAQGVFSLRLLKNRVAPIPLAPVFKGAGKLISKGLPVGLAAAMSMWAYQGILVLFRFLNSHQADMGQLVMVVQILFIMLHTNGLFFKASIPALSRSSKRKDSRDIFFCETVCRAAIVFGTAGGIIALAWGPWMIAAVFGPEYAHAGELIKTAIWIVIPGSCAAAFRSVLLAGSRYGRILAGAAIGAAVFTGSMFLLAPKMGAAGAVWAMAAGRVAAFLSLGAALFSLEKINVRFALIKPCLAAFFSVMVFFILRPLSASLAVFSALGALLAGVVFFCGISAEEKEIIYLTAKAIQTRKRVET
ncbi:conserved membrane hypothetical protein [Candidatus Desulfarcum epimagneticum]|uniref:Polysaccharide biosynthesis protein C-terminal domain-containing protein n=1 Tax=uncultured Desulfobacteraceae bacterium TaxID=218296 RepID=A0A484HNX7_9BACT|nr:conserved membrane hypothetical protein [uncultured Desulfobacteraceae bacterium]